MQFPLVKALIITDEEYKNQFIYLLQVIGSEGHPSQQFPHGPGQMEVERFPCPHGHSEEKPEELEVADVFGRGAGGIKHVAVGVETNLVGAVGCGDDEFYHTLLHFL